MLLLRSLVASLGSLPVVPDHHVELFDPTGLRALGRSYPLAPICLPHRLAEDPLFTLDRLAEAADAVPDACFEYRVGDGSSGFPMAERHARRPGEIVRSIEQLGGWAMLKQLDGLPRYDALIARIAAELGPRIAAITGAPQRWRSFVFISATDTLTPRHFDPEYNVLLQLAGAKTVAIGPGAAVGADELARYRTRGENLLPPTGDGQAASVDLAPGEALYIPYLAPHAVRVRRGVSISLSITWASRWSVAHEHAQHCNAALRAFGLPLPPPPAWPRRSPIRALGGRLLARAGVVR
jgi:hypothetical protein